MVLSIMSPIEASPIDPVNFLIVESRDGKKCNRRVDVTVRDHEMVEITLGRTDETAPPEESTIVIGCCEGGWVVDDTRQPILLRKGQSIDVSGVKYTGVGSKATPTRK